jgi:hypothetical protein
MLGLGLEVPPRLVIRPLMQGVLPGLVQRRPGLAGKVPVHKMERQLRGDRAHAETGSTR